MYWINIEKIGYISKISDILDFSIFWKKSRFFPSQYYYDINTEK